MQNARHIEWSDRSVAVPVFLTVALMPFTYSITAGVGAGVTSFAAIGGAGQSSVKWAPSCGC